MNLLIIWDKETEILLKNFLQEGDKKILSAEEYKYFDFKKDNKFEAVIILAELNWKDKYFLQDFGGIEILTTLRIKHKLLCPIIMVSSLKSENIEILSQSNYKLNILYGRGSAYINLLEFSKTTINTKIKEIHPLCSASLADVSEMLCNLRGLVVDKITHNIQFNKNENGLIITFSEIFSLLNSYQLGKIEFDSSSEKLINLHREKNQSDFDKTKEDLIKKCEQEIASTSTSISASIENNRKFKILLLEDNIDYLNKCKSYLQKEPYNNLFEIINISNSNEAIKKLSDTTIEITAVISDWRLYTDQNNKWWQNYQGYEVLTEAAKNRYVTLFALTSLSDRNVHNIRNQLGIHITLLKKQYLEKEAHWELFRDILYQRCSEIQEIIASDKNFGEGWTKSEEKNKNGEITKTFKSLRQQYIERRNSNQWENFENGISTDANKIWKLYQQSLDPQKERNLEDIGKKYGIQFEQSGVPMLKNILIVRRIWLALWFSYTQIDISIDGVEAIPVIKIYSILRRQYYDDVLSENKATLDKGKMQVKRTKKFNGVESTMSIEEDTLNKMTGNAKGLTNKLCITTGALPSGILPEERSWLINNGLDIETNPVFDVNEDEEEIENDVSPSDAEIQKIENNLDFEIENCDD